ncbi:MAG: hypothetical protein HYU39_02955 [Thaumarchaeota archaeon]|nr:hypothetical protein [Nitrososphaerota archaeon]
MEPQYTISSESTTKILVFLKTMLNSSRAVEDFVERSFRSATPEVLEYWVTKDVRLIPDTTRKLYFEHPLIRPVFKILVRKHWSLIQHYLGNPDRVIKKMGEYYPENKAIFESEKVRLYIEKELKAAYELFYGLIYG